MASPVRWHELGQTLGDGEGQGSLMDCSPRGRKEADTTGQQQQQDQQPHHALHYSTSISARTLAEFVHIDYFLMSVRQCVRAVRAQSCLTLGGPMDSVLPGSPVCGIFQESVLEWVAIL